MNINTTTSAPFSLIPDNNRVKNLRGKGFKVHVFQRKETRTESRGGKRMEKTVKRRIVAIKFPYAKDIYDVYDSELEDYGVRIPLRTLNKRGVKILQNDPTFTYEGPWDGSAKRTLRFEYI